MDKKIQTVGLLIDESYFFQKEQLIAALIANGFLEKNITTIVYRDKFKKKESYAQPTFGPNQLQWNAQISDAVVTDFVATKFDLLVSYYDIEKAILLLITLQSQADFKVGFSAIDNRLNHFMITTNAESFGVFVSELFRYLKILNKI
nr:hypothetical protein [Flavobacterium restrictum]